LDGTVWYMDCDKLPKISDFNASNHQEQYAKLCKANGLLLAVGQQTNQDFGNLLGSLMLLSLVNKYQDIADIDFGFELSPLYSEPALTLPPSITVVARLPTVSPTTSTLGLHVVWPASGAWPKYSSRDVSAPPMRARQHLFAVICSCSSCAVLVLVSRSSNNICSLSLQTTITRVRRQSYSSTGRLRSSSRRSHSAITPKI
jgi:hypothetical protein